MFEMLLSVSATAVQAKAEATRAPWPTNPFPTGMQSGRTTERVLALLRREAPRSFEHGQIRTSLSASRGMVTWSLKDLEAKGLVERLSDPRSPQFYRWRATADPLTE